MIAIIAIPIGMLLPAVQKVCEAATARSRRTSSTAIQETLPLLTRMKAHLLQLQRKMGDGSV